MGSLQAGGWESAPEQGKESLFQILCFSDPQVRCVGDDGRWTMVMVMVMVMVMRMAVQ